MQDMLHKMMENGHSNYEVAAKKAHRKPAEGRPPRLTQKPSAVKKS